VRTLPMSEHESRAHSPLVRTRRVDRLTGRCLATLLDVSCVMENDEYNPVVPAHARRREQHRLREKNRRAQNVIAAGRTPGTDDRPRAMLPPADVAFPAAELLATATAAASLAAATDQAQLDATRRVLSDVRPDRGGPMPILSSSDASALRVRSHFEVLETLMLFRRWNARASHPNRFPCQMKKSGSSVYVITTGQFAVGSKTTSNQGSCGRNRKLQSQHRPSSGKATRSMHSLGCSVLSKTASS